MVLNSKVAPSKGIQDSLGIWIVRHRFPVQIPRTLEPLYSKFLDITNYFLTPVIVKYMEKNFNIANIFRQSPGPSLLRGSTGIRFFVCTQWKLDS